jgi:hypothetical protein
MVVEPFLRNNPSPVMFFQRFIFSAKTRTITLSFFTNGIPAMKNPDALRIFSPECFGGKYKPLKKHNRRRIIS